MTVKQTDKNKIGGGKAGPGRPKGSVNKATGLLKDAILQAATKAGGEDGMIGYLEAQAKDNPAAFMTLLGKVLPTQHEGSLNISADPLTDLFERVAANGKRIGDK